MYGIGGPKAPCLEGTQVHELEFVSIKPMQEVAEVGLRSLVGIEHWVDKIDEQVD